MGASGGPNLVKDQLVFTIDAANAQSYITGSSTSTDLIDRQVCTLYNQTSGSLDSPKSWQFDGDGDYITWPQTSGQFSQNPMSIEMVLRADDEDDNGSVMLMDRAAYDGTTGIQVWYDVAGSVLSFHMRGSSSTKVDTSDDFDKGNWYHVIYTFNSTTGTIYVNGNNVQSGTITSVAASTTAVVLGKFQSTPNFVIVGRVALLNIYHKSFSQSEVSQNYNALKSRFGL